MRTHDKQRREQLYQKYPALFAQRGKERQSRHTLAYGLEHGDGWLALVDAACSLIQFHTEQKQKTQPGFKQPEILQCKEKFGTGRLYISESDDYIEGVIAFFYKMTEITCEDCGNPGTLRRQGWWHVSCDACEEKYRPTGGV